MAAGCAERAWWEREFLLPVAGQRVIDVLSPFSPDEPVLVDSPPPWIGTVRLCSLWEMLNLVSKGWLHVCRTMSTWWVLTVREDGFPIRASK